MKAERYSIIFLGEPDPIGTVKADIRSSSLDAALHPRGIARARIDTDQTSEARHQQFTIDSLQLESLVEYLRMQAQVRSTLEKELARDQLRWDPEGDPVEGEVWEWARIKSLHLGVSDEPTTRSFFEVAIECDWDHEHLVIASFRDGIFDGLRHE